MFETEQMQMQKNGIKPSKHRLLILNYLNTSNVTHLTADDIFETASTIFLSPLFTIH